MHIKNIRWPARGWLITWVMATMWLMVLPLVGAAQSALTFCSLRDNRANFDGDCKTDISVFERGSGNWLSLDSSSGNTNYVSFHWGQSGDIPVPGDYNADGKTDRAVFRPGDGTWYIATDTLGSVFAVTFGSSGDIPVARDYDGDGKADIAVFRPSTGIWYIRKSTDNPTPATNITTYVSFGMSGDRPVPGHYDNDNYADVAVFRPSDGTWYIRRADGTFYGVPFGYGSDFPVQADYDGDGKTDVAVFRPSAGYWYILNSSNNSFQSVRWGESGDQPVPGDYDGDGRADVAVQRPGTGGWYIRNWYTPCDWTTSTCSPFLFFTGFPVPAAYLPLIYW
jgi:hypothetical protein